MKRFLTFNQFVSEQINHSLGHFNADFIGAQAAQLGMSREEYVAHFATPDIGFSESRHRDNTLSLSEGVMSTLDVIRQESSNVKDFIKRVLADKTFSDMKDDKNFIKYLNSVYESIDESVSLEAYRLSRMIGSAQQSTQDFIDDNNINVKKLESYIRNLPSNEQSIIKDIINGSNDKRLTNIKKTFIKRVKESVNEAELKLGVKYVNKQGKEGFIQTGGSKNPKDWFWFDGKTKHPYDKVKKDLKPSKDQKKTGFSDYLKQGGRVWDNVNPSDSPSVNELVSLEAYRLSRMIGSTQQSTQDSIDDNNINDNNLIN